MTVEDVRVRMVVVDKDPMFALGLCSLIEKRPDIKAQALDLADLMVPTALPDVVETSDVADTSDVGDTSDIVLLDPGQFELAPAELADHLRLRFGEAGMIAYTSDPDCPRRGPVWRPGSAESCRGLPAGALARGDCGGQRRGHLHRPQLCRAV